MQIERFKHVLRVNQVKRLDTLALEKKKLFIEMTSIVSFMVKRKLLTLSPPLILAEEIHDEDTRNLPNLNCISIDVPYEFLMQ